ncbi:uncharacterized protein MKZ38_001382 [Zalerion maritima]|uniref:Uncharacterized protein n=1 Tax=Zalerion maritima TaxID=339359 RepID=A0AAD5WMK4_9PEZI|nr:uncharacterized protein MKZ38_001382 [Zalerion maritima]
MPMKSTYTVKSLLASDDTDLVEFIKARQAAGGKFDIEQITDFNKVPDKEQSALLSRLDQQYVEEEGRPRAVAVAVTPVRDEPGRRGRATGLRSLGRGQLARDGVRTTDKNHRRVFREQRRGYLRRIGLLDIMDEDGVESALGSAWMMELLSRRNQQQPYQAVYTHGGFAASVDAMRRCLAAHNFDEPFRPLEDIEQQSDRDTWIEYLAFEHGREYRIKAAWWSGSGARCPVSVPGAKKRRRELDDEVSSDSAAEEQPRKRPRRIAGSRGSSRMLAGLDQPLPEASLRNGAGRRRSVRIKAQYLRRNKT